MDDNIDTQPIHPSKMFNIIMLLLKFNQKPEKGQRQKNTRIGGVVISEGDQVCTRKREISSQLLVLAVPFEVSGLLSLEEYV